jgi:Fe-S-cluster-containing hydrogenase component 2
MQIFRENVSRKRLLVFNTIPDSITFHDKGPAEMIFSNGDKCSTACIGCKSPSCMYYDDSEIECRNLPDFPNDKSTEVCPVGAIKWDTSTETPKIDDGNCLHCGLCIKRCPVGALYYDGNVKVVSKKSKYQEMVAATHDNFEQQKQQLDTISSLDRNGCFIHETDALLTSIYEKLASLKSIYHNIVVRNLFIGLDCNCAMRRIGDVYTRMDAVYLSKRNSFGAVEVEFGKDTLDASRGILDDIAVLNTRYGIPKSDNRAVVVSLQLPNARQGYWQVVKDIFNVESIQINTITIGALLILLWNNEHFDPVDFSYYVDYDNMDIRSILERHLGRRINLSDKLLGILEPIK